MPYLNRFRRTGYDVANRIDLSNVSSVRSETADILKALYPDTNLTALDMAFRDCKRLYQGQYPCYLACETPYHNLLHVMDVCLAMARLMDGYEKQAEEIDRFGPVLFQTGMLAALFHDSGYIRSADDKTVRHGAEYTKIHEDRSAKFLASYLMKNKLDAWIPVAPKLVQYTDYDKAIQELAFEDPKLTTLGCLLGTADIIAQMSDRVYLEKCRDYLYQELEMAGLVASQSDREDEKGGEPAFQTPDEFLQHIPGRIQRIMRDRLQNTFGSVYKHAAIHFMGPNLYLDAIGSNFNHLNRLIESNTTHTLKRKKEGESEDWR